MRYRMLDVRIWCDEKFRSLSPLKPSGQALFLYLLTNPHTTSIPGLYRAGAGAMAEELGWSLIGFHRALQEIVAQGLVKADLKARVIFISNAIKYNKPQSPNVIRSWAVHWDEIPECHLKREAYASLRSFVQGLGKPFAQAFDEALSQRGIKNQSHPLSKACVNQEQKQEQEQEDQDEVKKTALTISKLAKSTQAAPSESSYQLDQENRIVRSMNTEVLFNIPLRHSATYRVTQQEYEDWQRIYTKIDVLLELRQLVAWNIANPNKRKQSATILRHIHAWLAKEQRQKTTTTLIPRSAFPMTLEHNLCVAKNWLNPSSDELDERLHFIGSKEVYE